MKRYANIIRVSFVVNFGLLLIISTIKNVSANGFYIRPPFNGTYVLTAYFDHSDPYYLNDNEVVIYTGESVTDCNPHCYQGHSGYDWGMGEGTPILAAADGIVKELTPGNDPGTYGNSIILEHSNGYHTLYAHLRETNPFNVQEDQPVEAGDVIGWSGDSGSPDSYHLHFGVYRGLFSRANYNESNVTDPFGWQGSLPDPLINYPSTEQGHTASCLWRSHDNDPISCADVVIEDGSVGFRTTGVWQESEIGHGYHMYFRNNDNNYDLAEWSHIPIKFPGIYKVYAWIPWYYATSTNATYSIWTADGWAYPAINQYLYSDEWVLLGTYRMNIDQPENNGVVLFIDTGETPGTVEIGVDAIKFRSYAVFLPLVMYTETTQPTATPTPVTPTNTPTPSRTPTITPTPPLPTRTPHWTWTVSNK
jgi:murein DD-endopeptidase MepM/ murein hydrolase activator NlpD